MNCVANEQCINVARRESVMQFKLQYFSARKGGRERVPSHLAETDTRRVTMVAKLHACWYVIWYRGRNTSPFCTECPTVRYIRIKFNIHIYIHTCVCAHSIPYKLSISNLPHWSRMYDSRKKMSKCYRL